MRNISRWLQKNLLEKAMAGFVLGCCVTTPIFADDIEIYTDINLGGAVAQPNIMFVMDSSKNMDTTIAAPLGYTYGDTYVGGYDATKIYYTDDGSVPATNGKYFDWAANKCDHSERLYDEFGVRGAAETGALYTTGKYFGQIAQFNTASNKLVWRPLTTNNAASRALPIECKQDQGVHGTNTGANKYIANKGDTSTGWASSDTGVATAMWPDTATNYYYLYTGDYLNYTVDPAVVGPVATVQLSLFEQLKSAIGTLVTSATNINIGLMQYDTDWEYQVIDGLTIDVGTEGGAVMYPSLDVNAPAGDFFPRLKTMNTSGENDSSIAETYFEALKYFGGDEIVYGNLASPSNQRGTKENGNPGYYQTPITETCQKNYIIMVSNGLSSYDYIDAAKRASLTDFDVGSCNTDTNRSGNTNYYDMTDAVSMAASSELSTIDNCLDEMADWANVNDVATRADVAAHEGEQTITTYTVGFGFPETASNEHLAGEQLLRDTARRGGGRFIEATDQAGLERALSALISEILKVNSTFSSPAVSVNAFNRATNLEDLYFTLFKPTDGEHWEGNLKKYKLEFNADVPFVADVNHNAAIDDVTGFFKDSSRSYWTSNADAPDGSETAQGGAAGGLVRGLKQTFTGTYTNTSGVLTPSDGALTSTANGLFLRNTLLTETLLDIVGRPQVSVPPSSTTLWDYRRALIQWAQGFDIKDTDGDGVTVEDRREMGDPLHAEPALVQYGELTDGTPDLVAYVATNDGVLHGFNTQDGTEHFAFVPQEMLPKLQYVFDNTGVTGKAYGLDGNVVPWINDANSNGTIDSGEHVYLYFGMRRGGKYIYSMDVTDRDAPKLRWIINGEDLSGDYAELGETWSAPNVERLKMGGVDRTVLIFGAGYDVAQDNFAAFRDSNAGDSEGRGIFIVDADTGALLWSAGPAAVTSNLTLPEMIYSMPARIKPLDIDSDGYTDRLYASDMGGQLWRIDIDNDASTAGSISATGGRIADLSVDGDLANNRRFYSPPDAALILESGKAPYVAIVAASGYRAHPLQTANHDRAYMIRDEDVYDAPATYVPVTEADLYDTTDNAIGQGSVAQVIIEKGKLSAAKGWYFTLSELDGTFVGEKALSEPLILNGVAVFTTYIPASAGLTNNSCTANDGTGAIYFVNVVDGSPTSDKDGDGDETRADRRVLLARGGIPPTPRVIITKQGIPTLCVGTECSTAGEVGTVQKMYWYELEQ